MAGNQAALLIGSRFEVVRELGRGSSATVYLARDPNSQQLVALKLLHEELVHAVGADRFEREIRVLARLRHPNMVAVGDIGRHGEQPFFTMPYVDGWTLRQRLADARQLSVDDALSIARQLCAALAYAHAQSVLHRDVKPENVLGAGETVYLTDFGLARALDDTLERTLTSSGLSLGTPAYMSPEQVAGDHAVDARSDQYSLALVLYECLAGGPAFRGASAQVIASARLLSDPVPLDVIRPGLPFGLTRGLDRALSRNPNDRFATIEKFDQAIREHVGS